jgi:ATP-dependent DNA ligase
VRIILKKKKRLYVLENSVPIVIAENAEEEVRNELQRHVDDNEHVACVMLASMSPKLQRQHENMDAHIMIMHIKK